MSLFLEINQITMVMNRISGHINEMKTWIPNKIFDRRTINRLREDFDTLKGMFGPKMKENVTQAFKLFNLKIEEVELWSESSGEKKLKKAVNRLCEDFEDFRMDCLPNQTLAITK